MEGRIQTRNYDDASGKRVYVTEVVAENVQFLEPKSASANAQPGYQLSYQQPSYGAPAGGYAGGNNSYQSNVSTDSFSNDFDAGDTLDIASDDLPF